MIYLLFYNIIHIFFCVGLCYIVCTVFRCDILVAIVALCVTNCMQIRI